MERDKREGEREKKGRRGREGERGIRREGKRGGVSCVSIKPFALVALTTCLSI